jgi:hypothetical protein
MNSAISHCHLLAPPYGKYLLREPATWVSTQHQLANFIYLSPDFLFKTGDHPRDVQIYLRYCRTGWCMFSGSWILRELGASSYARDSTPMVPPEPLGEVDDPDPSRLRTAVNRLRQAISLSTTLSWLRKVGFRVFIHELALHDPLEDSVRAAASGAVDGVVTESGQGIIGELGIVNTKTPPMYVTVDSTELAGARVEGAHGVIIMNPPRDPSWLMRIREGLVRELGEVELFMGLTIDGFRRRFLEELVGIVDGFVVLEVPSLASLGIRRGGPSHVGRCPHCYIDYLSSMELRKCGECGGRLHPVYGKWRVELPMELRVLRYKANEELRMMRTRPPRIINSLHQT